MNGKKWGLVIAVIIIILAVLGIFLYKQVITGRQIFLPGDVPLISFENPTLLNNAFISENFVRANVSVADSDIKDIIFNWNKKNYTMYNDSLILMYNFDNNLNLGENDTFVADLSRYGNNGSTNAFGVAYIDGFQNYNTGQNSIQPTWIPQYSDRVSITQDGAQKYLYIDSYTEKGGDRDVHVELNRTDIIPYDIDELEVSVDYNVTDWNSTASIPVGVIISLHYNGTNDFISGEWKVNKASGNGLAQLSTFKRVNGVSYTLCPASCPSFNYSINQTFNARMSLRRMNSTTYNVTFYTNGILNVSSTNLTVSEIKNGKILIENAGVRGRYDNVNISISKYKNGRYGRAFEFDGIKDYIRIENSPSLSFTGNFSVEAWILPFGNPLQQRIILCKGDGNIAYHYCLYLESSSGFGRLKVGGGSYPVSSVTPVFGQWNHVAVVFNGTFLFFLNGELRDIVAGYPGNANNIPLYIGYDNFGSNFFNGSIDEVRIWNRSLSSEEVREHYSSSLQKYNQIQWYLYVNQSNLQEGAYTYQAITSDNTGNQNSTEIRTINYNLQPQISFFPPTYASGTSITNNFVDINVSIIESSLRDVRFNWNNINYTLYNDSLVLMMNFDNRSELGENDTFVKDLSVYGNDGSCAEATKCPIWNSAGRYGGAFTFEGLKDYIEVPDRANLRYEGGDISIAVWAFADSTENDGSLIISKPWNGAGEYNYRITYNPSGIGLHLGGNTSASNNDFVQTSPISLSDSWHYIVAVANSSRGMEIYVDGVLRASKTYNILNWTPSYNYALQIVIGSLYPYGSGWGGNTGYSFKGSIDEVRIWNRSLSANEIKEQYYSNLYKYNQTQWNILVNQGGLTEGSYNYFACAKDIFSENCTETRSIIVTSAPTGETGTTSGGGGAPSGPNIYYFSEAQLFQGVYTNISRTDKINISIFSATHLIRYDSSLKNVVNFIVDSQKISLGIGNESNFDFDKDGKDDFILRLIGYKSGKIFLYLKGVEPEKPAEIPEVQENKTETITPPPEKETKKLRSWLFIVRNELFFYIVFSLVFIGLVVVLVIVYLHIHQAAVDRKPKEKHLIIHEEPKKQKAVSEVKPRIATEQNLEFLLGQKIKSFRFKLLVSLLLFIVGAALCGLIIFLNLRGTISGVLFYSIISVTGLLTFISFIVFIMISRKRKKLEHYLSEWQLKKLRTQRAILEEQGLSDNAT